MVGNEAEEDRRMQKTIAKSNKYEIMQEGRAEYNYTDVTICARSSQTTMYNRGLADTQRLLGAYSRSPSLVCSEVYM